MGQATLRESEGGAEAELHALQLHPEYSRGMSGTATGEYPRNPDVSKSSERAVAGREVPVPDARRARFRAL